MADEVSPESGQGPEGLNDRPAASDRGVGPPGERAEAVSLLLELPAIAAESAFPAMRIALGRNLSLNPFWFQRLTDEGQVPRCKHIVAQDPSFRYLTRDQLSRMTTQRRIDCHLTHFDFAQADRMANHFMPNCAAMTSPSRSMS